MKSLKVKKRGVEVKGGREQETMKNWSGNIKL